MKEKKLILDILTGKSDKKTHGIYLGILVIYTAISFLIAILSYPEPFSITTVWISSLGGPPSLNPGWLAFDINWCVFGFGMIPHLLWIHERTRRPKAVFQAITLLLCCLGMGIWGIIGLLYKNSPFETDLALFDFLLLAVAMNFFAGMLLYEKIKFKKDWPKYWAYGLIFIQLFVVTVWGISLFVSMTDFSQLIVVEWIASISFWYTMIATYFVVPGERKE
ncbi:MAG: hypothetical protein ACFFCS_19370 [Candidatus Hodarchaeota archaeon]